MNQWFSSYLKGRYQQTYVSGTLSKCGQVVSDVPQGSVLRSTLFVIYINDLPLALSECIADMVADDSTISAHNKYIDQVASTLSNELQRVNKWCENNHMTINISKTKLMYVTSKPTHRQLSNTHSLPSVYFLDSVVDESSSERLLDVTINNDLSWNTQVENVINKCNTFLYLLSFSLFKTGNGFTMLTFFPNLICAVLFVVIVLQSWETNL